MKFRSIQFWTTVVGLVGAPLFFGSVDLFWVSVWTILFSLSCLCGVATPMGIRQSRLLYAFLAVCGIYLLVAIIQIAPDVMGPLNDPTWAQANRLLKLELSPRISSRAEIPPLAAGHFLLFVTSFMSGFSIGTSRRDTDRLVSFAQYSILAYAVYGLAALVLTPGMILWAPKVAYRGSLTATFVNHNTAATFVGVGAIIWFCVTFSTIRSLDFSSLRLLLLTRSNEHLAFKIIARSVCALACFFALLLTRSRGGLICTCFGLLVAITLMSANWRRPKFWRIAAASGVAVAVIAGLLSQTGRIGSQGLIDDGRWSVYTFCLDALRQRPLLGTGIGSFADVFPALRSDEFYSWGVWDYAHSTILEIAVEMGVPVAALIIIAALGSLYVLVDATIKSTGRSRRTLAAITGIAVLTYCHSVIDFSLQIPGYLVVFGILIGCGLAHACSDKTDSQQRADIQSTREHPSSVAATLVRLPDLEEFS